MTYSRLSPETQELLSAYLDGEIDEAQRQELEQRLSREADLARALTELQDLKSAFAAMPRARAPRNFTLTPEQAGLKRRRAFPFWRWAAWGAAGAVALLMLFVFFAAGLTMLSAHTASAPPMLAAAPQAHQPQKEAAEPAVQPLPTPSPNAKALSLQAQPSKRFLSLQSSKPEEKSTKGGIQPTALPSPTATAQPAKAQKSPPNLTLPLALSTLIVLTAIWWALKRHRQKQR